MRWNGNDIRAGMFVTSTNGEKLGKVIRCDEQTFEVEKGFFFPKDYELRYQYITKVEGNDVAYSLTQAGVQPRTAAELEQSARTAEPSKLSSGAAVAAAASGRTAPLDEATTAKARIEEPATAKPRTALDEAAAAKARIEEPTAAKSRMALDEAATAKARIEEPGAAKSRIALMDEQIGIEKVSRETGHVRVKKVVKTEEKHVTVPVTREDIVIERVAVSRDAAALSSAEGGLQEARFQEETLDIPLHEEELLVTKRPVVREEVIVRTVLQSADQEAVAMLRHEEAEVEDTRRPSASRLEGRESALDPSGYSSPGSRR